MTRELSAKVLEFLHIGREGTDALLAIDTLGKDMTIRMNCSRTTDITADIVLTYPVNTDDEHLVLDGTRRQQCLPSQTSLLWPVGHADQDIIGIAWSISRPNRETQVETNEQEETDAPPCDDALLLPGLITTAFATNVEQMVLVVMMHFSLRRDEVTTIAVVLTGLCYFLSL